MALDERWIGLALAVSGSVAIGTSSIITKKGLSSSGQNSSDSYTFLKNPVWWAGVGTLFLGEVANFAAYTFAPPILVTPLGALSVIIAAVLASFMLNETLGHLGRLGCALSLIGALVIVLHAPSDKDISTVDEIFKYATEWPFLLYVFVTLTYIAYALYFLSPKYGTKTPVIYISICSLFGSISVMAIKGFGIALKLTFGGNNQFVYPSTYFFGLVSLACILMQLNYLNKALDRFSVNVVNLIYYVFFTSSTILASVILFQGFNTSNVTDIASLFCGFVIILLGVYVINISRTKAQDATRDNEGDEEAFMLEDFEEEDIEHEGEREEQVARAKHQRKPQETLEEVRIGRTSLTRQV